MLLWRTYRLAHGPLSVQRRQEYTAAHIVSAYAAMHRDPKRPAPALADFMLWTREHSEVVDDQATQVFNELSRVAAVSEKPRRQLWKRKGD